jgi:hypothetical protein
MAPLFTKAALQRDSTNVIRFDIAVEHWGSSDWAFRIVSRNAPPRPVSGEPPLPSAFKLAPQGPSAYSGSGAFKVTFVDQVVTEGGSPQPREATRDILAHPPEEFFVLPCDNHLDLLANEFAAILSPFFVSDDQNTFFAEPSLEEVTTEEWEDWVIPVPKPDPDQHTADWFKAIPLEPAVPLKTLPTTIDPRVAIDPSARFGFRQRGDWLTNELTAVQLGKTLVGPQGGIGGAIGARASLAAGTAAVATNRAAGTVADAIVTVGTAGLNVSHLQRLQGLTR